MSKSWKVVLEKLPKSIDELKSMPESSLQNPYEVAALFIAVVCNYHNNKVDTYEMMDFLRGPNKMTEFDKQFIRDRVGNKEYLARSFFVGSTPENNYEPNLPYTVVVEDNPYSYNQEGYIKLFIKSGGADSPRPITLRNKPSTGQWFVWQQLLLAGIRIPVKDDEWA